MKISEIFKKKEKKDITLEKERERVYKNMLAAQKENLSKRKEAPKEAYVSLKDVNKIYENRVQAVYDFNLDIKKNEFIVFVGPSGCGKSTTLRMIAGLESITYGDLFIDGTLCNDLEPKERDIAMVFQSYALYPHMSVYDNLAFSLKIKKYKTQIFNKDGSEKLAINHRVIKYLEKRIANLSKKGNYDEAEMKSLQESLEYYKVTPTKVYKMRHMDKKDIDARVKSAAEILELTPYLNRKPNALSGGQRQRVALGRAIVRNAKLFLMDEPLSNLDAKLRVQMRSEIVKLHERIGATTIYVTHDQTEAMTMASRIVVMKDGHVQQIGTPKEIYNFPSNLFVATFIGSPAMNIVEASYEGKTIVFENGYKVEMPFSVEDECLSFYSKEIKRLEEENGVLNSELSSYSEEQKAGDKKNRVAYIAKVMNDNKALIEKYEAKKKGDKVLKVGIRPEDIYHEEYIEAKARVSSPLTSKVAVAELLGNEYYVHFPFADKEFIAKVPSKTDTKNGDDIALVFDIDKIHLFDDISSKRIH